ncbi:MAG: SIS domain-containing protein [Chlamydiales bacterium]
MFQKRLKLLQNLIEHTVYTKDLEEIDGDKALNNIHFFLEELSHLEGVVYFIGNGGSAAIASHFCTDFLRTLGIRAAGFFDPAILTCFSNDFGYENVYKIPLSYTLKSKDCLIAISSSGESKNILAAVTLAKKKKAMTVTLTGFHVNNPLRQLGDVNFWVDSSDYGLVETAHFFFLHSIVDTFYGCKKKLNLLAKSPL